MVRILLTDAIGLIGAYTLNALLALPALRTANTSTAPHTILAGYHSAEQRASVPTTAVPGAPSVQPVLVDWDDARTWRAALRGADRVLLLTRLSANKVADVEAWMQAIEAEVGVQVAAATAAAAAEASASKVRESRAEQAGTKTRSKARMHVVHVGIHTDARVAPAARPPHETWMLDAEALIRTFASAHSPHISSSLLRINFDGYNGLLRPGTVAYYVPSLVRYGWMAREDIAAVAARVLVDAALWGGAYPLSAQAVSLADMARDAEEVVGFPVQVLEMGSAEFVSMAAKAPDYPGYGEYIRSVGSLFEGLRKDLYPWHKEVFAEQFEAVVGRKPATFREWLSTSPMRKKLDKAGS